MRSARKRREDSPPARRKAAAVPPREDAAGARPARPAFPWGLAGALTLLPLLWASRGPTLGVPVADDYLFLSRLAFERPLDFFGPMGAAYYWRPVSRQLYYLLVGPWLLRAPWVAALLAALLLLALYAVLYRLARRGFDRPLAAAIACFPLLGEPVRVLLAWPSAAQHLLGALCAALAVERAAAGGLVASSAATLLALLSNEAAFVVLPALPLVAWLRTRSRRDLLCWAGATLAVAALWAAGYAVARTHGAGLPAGTGSGAPWAPYPAVAVQALVSQLGYEGVAPALRSPLLGLSGVLLAAALGLSFLRPARRRIARAAPVLLGGLGWFLVGVAPLVFVLPDWNAWRTTVASLGLAFALTGWLGLAAPPLAGALAALRLLALLLATPTPSVVADLPPRTASSYALARLARLQRVVESTRRTLTAEVPRLPRGGIVRYWQIPQLAEVGFNGDNALRVWYRDTTVAWRHFGGERGMHDQTDALVEFERDRPWPAVRIEPEALRLYRAAFDAGTGERLQAADSLLTAARLAQRGEAHRFFGALAQSQAHIAWNLQDYARAESLTRVDFELQGETAGYWAMAACFALRSGDRASAEEAVRRCLALEPGYADGLQLAQVLGMAPARPSR